MDFQRLQIIAYYFSADTILEKKEMPTLKNKIWNNERKDFTGTGIFVVNA